MTNKGEVGCGLLLGSGVMGETVEMEASRWHLIKVSGLFGQSLEAFERKLASIGAGCLQTTFRRTPEIETLPNYLGI